MTHSDVDANMNMEVDLEAIDDATDNHIYVDKTQAQPLMCPDDDDIELTPEQKFAAERALAGENLFITGGSGCGKTKLLSVIVKQLRQRILPERIIYLNMNAQEAIHQHGLTLPIFADVTPFDQWEELSKKINSYTSHIWKNIEVIVFDDIQYLTPAQFVNMIRFVQAARGKTDYQWIFAGDFLAPVGYVSSQPHHQSHHSSQPQTGGEKTDFAFELKAWNVIVSRTIYLSQNFRQSDATYQLLLERLRSGVEQRLMYAEQLTRRVRLESEHKIESKQEWMGKVIPTTLCAQAYEVDMANESMQTLLPGESFVFRAQTGIIYGVYQGQPLYEPFLAENEASDRNRDLWSKLSAPETKKTKLLRFIHRFGGKTDLFLRVGSQVMLIADLSLRHGLIRGATGIVVGFTSDLCHFPVVVFPHYPAKLVIGAYVWHIPFHKDSALYLSQIPLVLGWHAGIRSLHGYCLPAVKFSTRDVTTRGQFYYVLSKVQDLNQVHLSQLDMNHINSHPKAVKYYEQIVRLSTVDVTKWQTYHRVPRAFKVDFTSPGIWDAKKVSDPHLDQDEGDRGFESDQEELEPEPNGVIQQTPPPTAASLQSPPSSPPHLSLHPSPSSPSSPSLPSPPPSPPKSRKKSKRGRSEPQEVDIPDSYSMNFDEALPAMKLPYQPPSIIQAGKKTKAKNKK